MNFDCLILFLENWLSIFSELLILYVSYVYVLPASKEISTFSPTTSNFLPGLLGLLETVYHLFIVCQGTSYSKSSCLLLSFFFRRQISWILNKKFPLREDHCFQAQFSVFSRCALFLSVYIMRCAS